MCKTTDIYITSIIDLILAICWDNGFSDNFLFGGGGGGVIPGWSEKILELIFAVKWH